MPDASWNFVTAQGEVYREGKLVATLREDELRFLREKLQFICDFYYEALGPANDEIADMAEEAWAVDYA